jgi:hypothetical protein
VDDGIDADESGLGDASSVVVPDCLSAPGGSSKLYEGGVTGLAGRDSRAYVVANDRLVSVPLAGGAAEELYSGSDVYGLVLLADRAYFKNAADIVSVALIGGPATVALENAIVPMTDGVVAADDTSLYFGGSATGAISRLTPPATALVPLSPTGVLPQSIAVYADHVYFVGNEIGGAGTVRRVSKLGGPTEVLLSGLGLVSSLAVDASGIYFAEEPSNFVGTGRIVRVGLDGSAPVTLVEGYQGHASSIQVAYGRIYYAAGSGIVSVPVDGGEPEPVGTAKGPGMLKVVGGNLIWVAPAVKAISDTTVPIVQTACLL